LRRFERLKKSKLIEELFKRGKAFSKPPLRAIWLEQPVDKGPAQVMFSVPKKIFKRAVDRNILKRRMREAYRLYKHELYGQLGEKRGLLAFVYVSKELSEFKVIDSAMADLIHRLGR